MKFKLMILALSILALFLLAASPAFQSVTRFPGNIVVRGSSTIGTGQTITSGGSTITAGGQTITAGGQTITAGGQTITAGGLTVTSGGANIVGGALIASGGIRLTAQAETVTATWVLTPTASYIVMTSSAEYTSSTTTPIITTTATAGDVVILRNGNASDALNIDGVGGTVECKANVAIGASDTLTLIFNGSDWNCVSSYDNS